MKTPLKFFGTAAAVLFLCAGLQAAPIVFSASLSKPAEDLTSTSPGTGFTTMIYDDAAHTLQVDISFSDLLGTTTASHIHAPTADPFMGTAGVATQVPTFSGFPLGVTSGSYDHTFDLTDVGSFNPTFVTNNGGTAAGAEAALISAMLNGKAYLNIHTTYRPGGEIRGFLAVPDGSTTMILLGGGLAALAAWKRRRRALG